jgi:glycosyltransferase involved in cell wall biosynthesis
MKILIVTPEYSPFSIGGGSEVYKQLVNLYTKKGHSVSVVYGYYPTTSWTEKIKQFKRNGVLFYQVPLIPTPHSFPVLKTRLPCNISAYFQLRKIIEKEKPDVAHLHGVGFMFIDIMARKLSKRNVPYILTNHGYTQKVFNSNFIMKFAWNVYTACMMNPTIKHAATLTFVSNYLKNDALNKYPEKSVTIYNGIGPDWHNAEKKTIDIRKRYGIKADEKIVLTVGRISEVKGIHKMLELLPQWTNKGFRFKYLIMGSVGERSYKKSLDKLISRLHLEKSVLFLGFIAGDERKQFFKQADIIAVPSLWEGFGLVLLEAIRFNKLIIANDKGGLPEIYKNYNKVVKLTDKNILATLKKKEKVRASFDFSTFRWNRISTQYLELLTEVFRSVE